MPFTLSHPAAVLPLARTGLPLAGMVVGSMVPDVPMFGLVPWSYSFAHALVGVITVDLALGVVAAAVWTMLVRGVVIDAAPDRLRGRIAIATYRRREWALLPFAVIIGSLSHVGWDEFTHAGRWGTGHIAWLREQHAGYAGYHWAQAVSSAGGLLIIAAYVTNVLRRRAHEARPVRRPTLARWALGIAVLATVTTGLALFGAHSDDGVHAAAITAAAHALAVAIVTALAAGVIHRLAVVRVG